MDLILERVALRWSCGTLVSRRLAGTQRFADRVAIEAQAPRKFLDRTLCTKCNLRNSARCSKTSTSFHLPDVDFAEQAATKRGWASDAWRMRFRPVAEGDYSTGAGNSAPEAGAASRSCL